MAEYIGRDVAFNAITDLAGKASTRSAYEAVWKSARALKKIPAADVAPVVHGRWIPHDRVFGDDFLVCSKCQFVSEDRSTRRYYHYCPHCGAIMDGGADHAAD